MIKVLIFASFREKLKCRELSLDDDQCPDRLSALREQLAGKNDDWREVMDSERTLVAINQVVTRKDINLNPGDEVAFFPPVTGG